MASTDSTTVSVVMPCYNGMPFLPGALESAVAQTHRPIEIIVVDDGSKDDSAAVVRQSAARYPDRHVKLIQQANAGEPAARNTGIAEASGQWIAMLDTDDWWQPDKLEKQLAAAQQAEPQCVMVHTAVMSHMPDGSTAPSNIETAARRTGWCTEAMLEPASIAHPSIMVRRDALDKIGGYDPSFRQACDIDLYFRLSVVGTFAFVPEYLLNYRKHPGQMSASQFDQVLYHHRAVRKFMEQHGDVVDRIGRDRFTQALADHVAVKLESFYWRRRLDDFRRLLNYASEHDLDTPRIRAWRKQDRWPHWMIHLKDRLTAGQSGQRARA